MLPLVLLCHVARRQLCEQPAARILRASSKLVRVHVAACTTEYISVILPTPCAVYCNISASTTYQIVPSERASHPATPATQLPQTASSYM